VDNQSRDGSWGIASSSGKQQKNTGVVNGNAGIVLCLLKYYNEFQDPRVLDAIKKGLSWLSLWVKVCPLPMNTRQRLASPWLKEGYTGVALTFLTADSILPGYRCLETAMSLLSTHPKFLNGTFLGFANGVSGIGLTLLDMFKSNNNDTWLKSSTWIASLISEFSVCNSQNDILWLADKQDGQDMSFMNGNAGILHFLINQIKNI
jgi:lantibiotic modifying enzyme